MAFFHKNLSQEKWNNLAKDKQVLNIGAELGRAKNWLINYNIEYLKSSLARALELIDLTVEDKKWQGRGIKEWLRLKEMLAEFYVGQNKDVDEFLKLFRILLNFNHKSALVKI